MINKIELNKRSRIVLIETLSKTTLFVAICGYTFLGTMVDTNMEGDVEVGATNSHTEYLIPNPSSYYGSPIGLVIRTEQSIDANRTYISVANRSGKRLSCDFGDGKIVVLLPEDNEMQLLPMPVDVESEKMPTCLRG